MGCAATETAGTNDFHIFFKSSDSEYNDSNSFAHFVSELPSTIILPECKGYIWTMALTDICLLSVKQAISIALPESCIILCPLVQPSIIKNTQKPILRQIWKGTEAIQASLMNPIYRPVKYQSFNKISIEVVNHELEALDTEKWIALQQEGQTLTLSIVLHFQLTPTLP